MRIVVIDCDRNRKIINAKSFTFLFGLDSFIYWDEFDNSYILPISDIYSVTY